MGSPPSLPARFALALLLATGTLWPRSASCQLVTDRPDFVEAVQVVGGGVLQVETSLAGADDRGAGWTLSTPTLLRLGIGTRWEVRLETEGYTRVDDPSGVNHGMADASVGTKVHLGGVAGGGAALLAHVDLPTGSELLRGEGARPSLRGVMEWGLGPSVSVGVMAGGVLERDGADGRTASGLAAVVAGWSLSDKVRVFLEGAAWRLARASAGGNEMVANLGGALLVHDDLQLDAAVSLPLVGDGPHVAFTLGLSRRFR